MKRLFAEIPYIRDGNIEIRKLEAADALGLKELTKSEDVYRYLPAFLFEKKYEDTEYTISRMYDECLEDSLILGVFLDGEFCGLEEIYGYRFPFRKVSVGHRFLSRFWGEGIATRALSLVVEYLFTETDVKIITASVLRENEASSKVLKKLGFRCVLRSVPENWGYFRPLLTDKWIRTAAGYSSDYRINSR